MRYVGPRHIVIDGEPTPCPYWEPTREFDGQTVAIIGSGPSLATFDMGALDGRRFIVVNSGCRRLRQVATDKDILYFTDNAWNENRPELAADWPGPVVCANRNAKARLRDAVRYIDVTELTARMGTLPDATQASSGHIATSLAAVMGARKIVLMGFECRAVGGQTHGHTDYTQTDEFIFVQRFLPGWQDLSRALDRMGVDVVNCTPESALTCFRQGEWVEEMAR